MNSYPPGRRHDRPDPAVGAVRLRQERRQITDGDRLGARDYEKVYLYPNSHAGYYPGAKPIAMKVLFRKSDGQVIGAQAVGEGGVDKRISHLALAIQLGATVYDLEEAELCYGPPFGSAKDPINFAGMVAAGGLRGDMPVSHWGSDDGSFLLDVRQEPELAVEEVTGAINIPLGELRTRLDELPRDREIHVLCRSGQRAYYATRILLQHGFGAKVRSGGMLSHAIMAPAVTGGAGRGEGRDGRAGGDRVRSLRGSPRTGQQHRIDPGRGGGGRHLRHRCRDHVRGVRLGALVGIDWSWAMNRSAGSSTPAHTAGCSAAT